MTNKLGHHVVVVGGGVIGLTTAASLLANAPRLSVAVIERSNFGDGVSGYAGAMDIPYFRNSFQRELVQASWAWHEARGAAADEYRRMVPMTWYAEPDLDLQSSVTTPLASEPLGASPGWRAPQGTRCLYSPSFVIEPRVWCRSLARELAQSGRCELSERVEVIGLEPAPRGQVQISFADGRCHAADHVVLALGPWLPGWDQRTRAWASGIGLRTKRVFGLDVEVAPVAGPGRVVGWPTEDIYFHPTPLSSSGGAYRLSLRHDEWDVDPDLEHPMVDVVLNRASRFLNELLGVGGWSVVGQRVFADSYTPDFQAVVGPCSALGEDVTIATGTHGSGVRIAPGIADLVANAVLGRLVKKRG